MSVGKNIKIRRKQLGMSAERLAELLGLSPSTVYRYESGAIEKVNSDVIPALAKALNTTPAYIMGLDADNSRGEIVPQIASDQPNVEIAASKAIEVLISKDIKAAPILPLSIMKTLPNVLVVSFTEMADSNGVDNDNLVTMFGTEHQDAVTYAKDFRGKLRYIVAYNQRLPFYMLQLALARELGHIMLGHDNVQSNNTQTTEAMYFARYLLCPRPLIQAMRYEGIHLTVETVGNITGCYGRCLAGIRKTPGAHVQKDYNRTVRNQFSEYVGYLKEYQNIMTIDWTSDRADFGTYMDNYEE